jgi:hypothetical protein
MEAIIVTLVNQFGFVFGLAIAVVGTVLLIIRNRASTQDYTMRQDADIKAKMAQADIDERKRLNDAIFALVEQLNKRSEDDRRRSEDDRKSQIENNLTLKSAVSKIEGMMLIVADATKTTQGLSLSFNDMEREFGVGMEILKKVEANTDVFKTDVVGEMSVQFGPVVEALKAIIHQIELLSKKIAEKDADTAASFNLLVESISQLEIKFLRALEPIVIKQLGLGDISNEKPLQPVES